MPFKAPSFAIPYHGDDKHSKHGHSDRSIIPFQEGFWWVEVGSDFDIVGDFDTIRHKLMGYAYGVWDYAKNSGQYPETENFALNWVGSVPGRRESRRFIGDHILSETDLLEHKHFDDAVAFGGWPLDEHNPGGIENLDDPPSFWHSHFDKVYEIPYRSLFSKDVSNLLFAGRNVSVTHVALSSTRVMATCSTMGQAVGTAAALCVQKGITPRELGEKHIAELQEQLMLDDAYIPNRPACDSNDLAKTANRIHASSTSSGDVNLLVDGVPRDEHGEIHHWASDGLSAEVAFEWDAPVPLSSVMVKCDTNVNKNIMMLKTPRETESYTSTVPKEMLKAIELEACVNGEWIKLGELDNNRTRLIKFRFEKVEASAVRIRLKETYGAANAKLFEVRCYES
ncbi:hypothetical protein SCARR_00774 [Pontiella sulfatireligans]|uniref:FAD dependent oxidoreductase n=2 Tax=Pontiella sulfatireligans TaxID=2750658 RepID=A0A6C2UH31_9BACT|nr:hypothetical protein SCARR_00774 [Pontiella sulfatireligans]